MSIVKKLAEVIHMDAKARLKRRIKSPGDARFVIDIIKREIEERKKDIEIIKNNVRVVKDPNIPSWERLQLVAQNGDIVANVSYRYLGDGEWAIYRLWVGSYYFNKAKYRGTGLARALLNALEEYLIKRGAKVVRFNAKPNIAEFYEKLGAVKDASRNEVAISGLVPMKFVIDPSKKRFGK